jgi:hypothetical protein
MLKTTTMSALLLAAVFCLTNQKADAANWADTYYDYDLYYGVSQDVYDLYVVYNDGTEDLYHTYTRSSSLSYQMYAFAEGKRPTGVVDWYYTKDRRVVSWHFYSNYATRAQADSNADWLELMGYETDLRLVYNPNFKTRSFNLR